MLLSSDVPWATGSLDRRLNDVLMTCRWLLNGSNDVGSLLSRLAHQQAYSQAGMDSDDTEASAGSM